MILADQDILAALRCDGFHVIDRYLDLNQVQHVLEAVERLSDSSEIQSARIKRGVVFARRNLLSVDFIRDFIASDCVQSFIDRVALGVVPVRAIMFDKTGDANWTVPWHQDRAIAVHERVDVEGFGPWSRKAGIDHVQPPVDVLRAMVTLRFSLDACGPENGPLRVIPGTHERILNQHEVDQAVSNKPEVSCISGVGGVVVMRPLLLHASSPAKDARHRRILHIEFGPRTLPGGLRWAMV